MNLNAILNADMATLGRWITEASAWWLEELRGLIPAKWRDKFSPRQEVIAQLAGEQFVFWRAGDGTATLFQPRGSVRRARLVLPPELVLEREIALPVLSERDTRQMVSLEVDRWTPFSAGEVYWDVGCGQATEDGRRRAVLAVLRREDASAVLAAAQECDIGVRAISVGVSPNEAAPRFDFCPAMKRAKAMPSSTAPFWWSLAAVLLALNVGLLAWRDTVATDQLRAVAESQKVRVELALKMRERAGRETAARATFLAHRSETMPLPLLEALTQALPAKTWVQRLDWDGTSLEIKGYKDPKLDIVRAIERTMRFANVATGDGASPENVAVQPFEVTADAKRSVKR